VVPCQIAWPWYLNRFFSAVVVVVVVGVGGVGGVFDPLLFFKITALVLFVFVDISIVTFKVVIAFCFILFCKLFG
jgi:hypothetical protein